VGLGKTFVGSVKLAMLNESVNILICQKSKVDDWIEHFREYHKEYEVFDGTKKADLQAFFDCQSRKILIINYDLLYRRPQLNTISGFTLMLDESSMIQNETAKRTKYVLKMRAKNVILLSGTPTGGKYEKLWSQCKLLGWDITKNEFWNKYVKYRLQAFNGFPQKIVYGYKNVEDLKDRLGEHGAVFMKSDEVLDLPQQIDSKIYVPTTKEYREFRRNSIVIYNNVQFVGDMVLKKMLYERLLCGWGNKEKLKALEDLLNSTDDRLIIFYNFVWEVRAIAELIGETRPIAYINGKVKDLSKYEEFDNSVTLIQYQAGAMGLNLQKANKIIYFTPPLSSELFEQSKKRIHRMGQERSCFYYYLTCKDSIEERIYKTLAMRQDYTARLFEKG